MNRAQEMTRMAAAAYGYDLRDHIWIDHKLGFFPAKNGRTPSIDVSKGFAPLSDHADAYKLEDRLRMEVAYRAVGAATGHVSLVISVRTQGHGGAVMHTVPAGAYTLTERMYAVTQFAALHSVMEDMPDAQQQR